MFTRSVSGQAFLSWIVDADKNIDPEVKVRGRIVRSAVALGSAGLVVLGMAGCTQSQEPSEGERRRPI